MAARPVEPADQRQLEPRLKWLMFGRLAIALVGVFAILLARRGEGCAKCRFTGYYGLTGIFEELPMNPRLRHLVADVATPDVLLRTARQDGLRTLREHADRKVAAGETSYEEAVRGTADGEARR